MKNIEIPFFRYWWVPLVTGILSLGVGVLCFIWPETSLASLAIIFECCLLVAGIFNVCYALANTKTNPHWGWPFANGLIEIILAVWLWTMPLAELTLVFVYIVGFWVLFMCIYGITEALTLSSYKLGWVSWIVALILIGLIFALVWLMGPVADTMFVWIFIGVSFLCYGVSRIVMACRLKVSNDRNS